MNIAYIMDPMGSGNNRNLRRTSCTNQAPFKIFKNTLRKTPTSFAHKDVKKLLPCKLANGHQRWKKIQTFVPSNTTIHVGKYTFHPMDGYGLQHWNLKSSSQNIIFLPSTTTFMTFGFKNPWIWQFGHLSFTQKPADCCSSSKGAGQWSWWFSN